MTEEQLNELSERSKDDRALIVGSEIRSLIAEVRRLNRVVNQSIELTGPELSPAGEGYGESLRGFGGIWSPSDYPDLAAELRRRQQP